MKNGADKWFSNKFGFGSMDAGRMVELAKEWKLVGKPAMISTKMKLVGKVFKHSLQSSFKVRRVNNIKALEKVAIAVDVRTKRRGDVSLWLRSPAGTSSTLMTRRTSDDDNGGWAGWTFSTNAFFGEERVNGEWVLGMENHGNKEVELVSWRLTFFGSSVDNKLAWNSDEWTRNTLYSIHPPSPKYFEDQEGLKGREWSGEDLYQPGSMDDEWVRLSGYFSSDPEFRKRRWHRMDGKPDFLPRDQSKVLLLKIEQKDGTDWLLWSHLAVLMWLICGKYVMERMITRWRRNDSRKHHSLPL